MLSDAVSCVAVTIIVSERVRAGPVRLTLAVPSADPECVTVALADGFVLSRVALVDGVSPDLLVDPDHVACHVALSVPEGVVTPTERDAVPDAVRGVIVASWLTLRRLGDAVPDFESVADLQPLTLCPEGDSDTLARGVVDALPVFAAVRLWESRLHVSVSAREVLTPMLIDAPLVECEAVADAVAVVDTSLVMLK